MMGIAIAMRPGAKFPTVYTPKDTKDAEADIGMIALVAKNKARAKIIEGPVHLTMLMVYPTPKAWSKKKRQQSIEGKILPTVKPDIDNVEKLVCDALNGIVWVDDKQVCMVDKVKIYGEEPRNEITVREMNTPTFP